MESWANIASSDIRRKALSIVLRKPSCVWVNDTAFTTLLMAASRRLSCDSKRLLTAKPAASSEGAMILEPEESRARDLARAFELTFRLLAVCCAWTLVLMTILVLGWAAVWVWV